MGFGIRDWDWSMRIEDCELGIGDWVLAWVLGLGLGIMIEIGDCS